MNITMSENKNILGTINNQLDAAKEKLSKYSNKDYLNKTVEAPRGGVQPAGWQ